jgi:hypothetical protein
LEWYSPKNANLDKAEIDVEESEVESFYTVRGMVLCIAYGKPDPVIANAVKQSIRVHWIASLRSQ